MLWTVFAFRLSSLNLRLVATTPMDTEDSAFLAWSRSPSRRFPSQRRRPLEPTWRHDILVHGAKLMSFKLDAIVLLILVAIIALGPLAFFGS
jgi:hypothetical protein